MKIFVGIVSLALLTVGVIIAAAAGGEQEIKVELMATLPLRVLSPNVTFVKINKLVIYNKKLYRTYKVVDLEFDDYQIVNYTKRDEIDFSVVVRFSAFEISATGKINRGQYMDLQDLQWSDPVVLGELTQAAPSLRRNVATTTWASLKK